MCSCRTTFFLSSQLWEFAASLCTFTFGQQNKLFDDDTFCFFIKSFLHYLTKWSNQNFQNNLQIVWYYTAPLLLQYMQSPNAFLYCSHISSSSRPHHVQQSHRVNVERRSSATSSHAAVKELQETVTDGVEWEIGSLPPQILPDVVLPEMQQSSSLDPQRKRTVRRNPEERTGQQAGNWRNKSKQWLKIRLIHVLCLNCAASTESTGIIYCWILTWLQNVITLPPQKHTHTHKHINPSPKTNSPTSRSQLSS